jgi:hypothetical protein
VQELRRTDRRRLSGGRARDGAPDRASFLAFGWSGKSFVAAFFCATLVTVSATDLIAPDHPERDRAAGDGRSCSSR